MRAEEMRDIIISKLKDGPKTTPELVEMTGFSPEQIRERMRRAKVEGMVESAVIDKEFMWYDKKQWDHVVQVKEDKGPITFGECKKYGRDSGSEQGTDVDGSKKDQLYVQFELYRFC